MRAGLAVSVIGHVAVLAFGFLSLSALDPLDVSQLEALPVDFIEIDEFTEVRHGQTSADPAETSAPNNPVPEPAEEPVPPPPEPEPVSAPEPPPPPPPPPEPEAAAAPEPEPVPEPEPAADPAPIAEAPAPTPEPEAPLPDPEPQAAQPDPEAAPAPQQAAVVPVPRARPQRPTPPRPDADENLDLDRIAALLDQTERAAPALLSEDPASLGAPTRIDRPRMTQNELDALRARLAFCWTPPIGWTDPAEVRVSVEFSLNPDGSVSGAPRVVETPIGRYAQTAPESAVRAIRLCEPFNLPPEKYESWREIRFTFDPRDM